MKWNQDPGPRLYYCFLGCLSLSFASLPFQECYCCSVTQSCPSLYDVTDCNMSGFPVLHHLWELAQTHVESIMHATISSESNYRGHWPRTEQAPKVHQSCKRGPACESSLPESRTCLLPAVSTPGAHLKPLPPDCSSGRAAHTQKHCVNN